MYVATTPANHTGRFLVHHAMLPCRIDTCLHPALEHSLMAAMNWRWHSVRSLFVNACRSDRVLGSILVDERDSIRFHVGGSGLPHQSRVRTELGCMRREQFVHL